MKVKQVLKKPVYVPLDAGDFSITRKDDSDTATTYTIPAGEIQRFDEPIAEYIKKHLVNHLILNVRGRKPNYKDAYDKIYREVSLDA